MSFFSSVIGQQLKVKGSTGGFLLVEMLFYVAILSLCFLAVTETLIVATRAFGSFRTAERIVADAEVSLERMVREARDANGINGASVLSSHPGKLVLDTTNGSGAPRTVEFYLASGKLMLKEDGIVTGALTGGKTIVANLIFRRITTARSQGVKIEMTLASGTGSVARTENFYATAVLRDSY